MESFLSACSILLSGGSESETFASPLYPGVLRVVEHVFLYSNGPINSSIGLSPLYPLGDPLQVIILDLENTGCVYIEDVMTHSLLPSLLHWAVKQTAVILIWPFLHGGSLRAKCPEHPLQRLIHSIFLVSNPYVSSPIIVSSHQKAEYAAGDSKEIRKTRKISDRRIPHFQSCMPNSELSQKRMHTFDGMAAANRALSHHGPVSLSFPVEALSPRV